MMSSPESPVTTADDPIRVRREVSVRAPAQRSLRASDRAVATSSAPQSARATSRLVRALHATPLLGVAGAIALYWSTGGPRDVLFAVGIFLLLSAVTVFHQLRARLIARLERPALEAGLSKRHAHERAVREVDKLIRASLRFEGSSSNAGKRWPPISLG